MSSSDNRSHIKGTWINDGAESENSPETLSSALLTISKPVSIVEKNGKPQIRTKGTAILGKNSGDHHSGDPLLAYVPALPLENL